MDILINKTVKKLRRKARDEFLPTAEQMRKEGMCDHDILVSFDNYRKVKRKQFYQKARIVNFIKEPQNADSTAEVIFYNMLQEHGVPFDFQYKIGKYRVDYLINKMIVFEGDGPHHEYQREYDKKRDLYLTGLGYEVIRMSWGLISQIPELVINELKDKIILTK